MESTSFSGKLSYILQDTPPRDIKKEIERRAMEIEEQREADNKAANKDNKDNKDNKATKAEAEADESNR